MTALRSLRRSRALTLFDIARLTGIPVRVLAEFECGLHSLSDTQRTEVAFVFGLRDLPAPAPAPRAALLPQPARQALAAAALAAALATAARPAADLFHGAESATRLAAAVIGSLRPQAPAPAEPQRAAAAAPLPTAAASPTTTASATPTPAASATPSPSATATASATPSPSATATPPVFLLTERGPLGCPLRPQSGEVVMTQGYAVGTHSPADVMGAIDLAIDGGTTFGSVVLATHAGVARTQPDTWPAGNHIWVMDDASGWRTGYAHLSAFLVSDGQFVEAGAPIGLVGSTGYSTGPHLHYHVWHYGTNVDPTDLATVCFR
jgi:murein DD-endopeptidase MepM/ murein hydrolase activator NlpD